MLERIEDVPEGTIGFRATGHVRVRHSMGLFGWMAPGEVMGGLDELEAAKAWLTDRV
jgi:hypothetical protein